MMGFNGSVPGPPIRVRRDDKVVIRLENALEDGTILHLHGIRLPNAMDGVNVLTQDAIEPGGSFEYRFDVPDAGTFWYHSHYSSLEQVSQGLFGPLIVEEPYPPDVDQDVTIVLFDALSDGEGDFDREYYRSHYRTAGRIGDVLRAFGSSSSVLVGQRLRFRFINVSVDRVFRIHVQGVEGAVVALDGMPLAHLHPLEDIKLAPGQRSDVIGDVLDDVLISEVADRTPVALKTLAATGTVTRRSSEIQPLPPNNLPAPSCKTTLSSPMVCIFMVTISGKLIQMRSQLFYETQPLSARMRCA
jgi:FtsP/CotA-like multicopper oxidase with cupredoxin domain